MRRALWLIPLLLAGCGAQAVAVPPPGPIHLLRSGSPRATVAAGDRLAGRLFGQLPSTGNLIVSPYSLDRALQMAELGARGRTATEMAAAVGRPMAVPLPPGGQQVRLRTADTVWIQRGLSVEAGFRSGLREDFAASLRSAPFQSQPDRSRRRINALIGRQTAGHIPDLLPPGTVTTMTRLVLADAVYLKAAWANAFPASATEKGTFHLGRGHSVRVPLMRETAQLGYAAGPGYQAVTLPYAGHRLAMTILLPVGGVAPLEARLARGGLAPLTAGSRTTRVMLTLPRFRFRTTENLDGPLERLGMTAAFGPSADFRGITAADPLSISLVTQQAQIVVDERGTEASAATGVVVGTTVVAVRRPTHVVVNRPFLFVITATATGAPLFLGRVDDPATG